MVLVVHSARKAVHRHPISPTVSEFAIDSSAIDLTHDVPMRPHLTRPQASKSTSSPIAASGSRVTLDVTSARHNQSPRNRSTHPPNSKRVFLSDSEIESDEELSIIHVKTQGAGPPVPTVHEANASEGEHSLDFPFTYRHNSLCRCIGL